MSVTENKLDKYQCVVCNSIIKNNPKNIAAHFLTLKHKTADKPQLSHSDDKYQRDNRLRMEETRKRLREQDNDAYKRKEAERKRLWRLKQKLLNQGPPPIQPHEVKSVAELPAVEKAKKDKIAVEAVEVKVNDDMKKVIDKLVSASKGTVQAKTIEENLKRIKNIYSHMFNKPWDFVSYDWLKDYNKVFLEVEKKYKTNTDSTRRNQYVSIAGILKFFPAFKQIKGIYSKLGSSIQDKLDNISKDNRLSKNQRDFANWREILEVWKTLGDNKLPRALFAIYCFIPPRRIQDYWLMKIVRKDKISATNIAKLSTKFNYIFVDKNSKPLSFTINTYKSGPMKSWAKQKNNSGAYTLNPIPEKLSMVLQDYIKESKLASNDFLFGLGSNKSKPYASEASFGDLISKKLFQTFSGKNITITNLRHAFVSWIWDKQKTIRDKENLAYMMGTSVDKLQSTYYKIDLTPDSDKK